MVQTPAIVVDRARPAMGSLFRLRLVGDDEEHLAAVAEAALDEIERVERLLSWRDSRSETARINRSAAEQEVLVDYEMADVLATCAAACEATDGYFDVAHSARREPRPPGRDRNVAAWMIDVERRLVRFRSTDVRLDFGAFGKGYALDCAAREVRRFGVHRGLIDGGTSSVLAIGLDESDRPWAVGLRDPFAVNAAGAEPPIELAKLTLSDSALSCSSTFDDVTSPSRGETLSDLVDPHVGRPLRESAACGVVARSAATAEIFSTALVCMGRDRASAYIERWAAAAMSGRLFDEIQSVEWIEPQSAADHLHASRVSRLYSRPPGA